MKKRIKTLITLIAMAALFLMGTAYSYAEDGESEVATDGTSVIMTDAATGTILYEKNSEERRDPASVTKILTCLVVLENLDMDEKVTITEDSSPIGNNIAMKKDEVLTVEQLVYAMMLPSANDAARQLAIATSGDVDSFCKVMNDRAKECGAVDTNFTNPNGLNLPGQENHKTTAWDLAQITSEALKNETFRKIVSTRKYIIPKTNKSEERVLRGTNPLLGSKESVEVDGTSIPLKYEGATGVKTGTTSTAGNCFVGSAKRGDTELIVVTLNSGDRTRFTDAIRLMDYGFEHYETKIIAAPGDELATLKVRRGETGSVQIGTAETLAVTDAKDENGQIIDEGESYDVRPETKKLTAPVRAGDVVGTVALLDGAGEVIKEVPAVALSDVAEGGILSHIGIPDDMVPIFAVTMVTLLLIVLVIIILARSRKKGRAAGSSERKEPGTGESDGEECVPITEKGRMKEEKGRAEDLSENETIIEASGDAEDGNCREAEDENEDG
ncbi:MAG: D-alanyl-D-alanine carboxypeptidase [Firmicutes bacterium]|nr:D-alanyl-D-alanine carboxypeptidase [Bacillota bacterium]